ncbi:MAG: 5'-nucleotidase C-terminal domain-containing protein [Saprospiraceae bacterium]|nr:5'-nucleotidase C-terminal domain-containing protein [Saprospiraceae bacterium]
MANHLKHFFFLFLIILITSCSKQIYVAEIKSGSSRIDKTASVVDPGISEMISPYKSRLDSTMNEEIGYLESEMIKARPSSSLGNWFADVLYDDAILFDNEVKFALQNYGGIRIPSIASGPLTVGKMYELMPFDNTLFIVTLDSAGVIQLLDRIAEYGGWPVSSKLNFLAEYGKAKDIFIDGSELSSGKTYKVAMPDYVANGGDNCGFLADYPRIDTGLLIRDLMISHVRNMTKSGKNIVPNNEQRIKDY